jgi:hypothetical protein
MQKSQSKLPSEIQLQAVCMPRLLDAYDLLISFLPELKEWNPKHGSHELYKERVKEYFNFTVVELVKYLETRPEVCKMLLNDSYDKRYTPSTFIEEKQGKYRVGWVPGGQNPINQIRVFSSFAEATADYVLFSWGFPRLKAEQANWVKVEHY